MWNTLMAACTGRGHRLRQQPGQDRTARRTEYGVTAIALADGAGSAPLSHLGAECAVQTACRLLCRDFEVLYASPTPQAMRQWIVEQVQEAIAEKAALYRAEPSELACTLLAVAVCGDRYLLFHVGDGVIAYQKAGKLLVASRPCNGEFTNTTVFVTSRSAAQTARVLKGTQAALEGFVLMSDGCEQALYHKRTASVAPLLGHVLQWSELLQTPISEDMLHTVLEQHIAARTTDDCSLAVMSRAGEHFGRWDRLTPREQSRIFGVATQNKSRRRRALRRIRKQWGR